MMGNGFMGQWPYLYLCVLHKADLTKQKGETHSLPGNNSLFLPSRPLRRTWQTSRSTLLKGTSMISFETAK